MDFPIQTRSDLDRLDASDVRQRLGYVLDAIRLIRESIGDATALLGFAGSPWTLATYMIEGGSSRDFAEAKRFFLTERDLFDDLLEMLTGAVCHYLDAQIDAGVDAVQIFDSWGGALSGWDYEEASLSWIRRIVQAVAGRVPVILYARNTYGSAPLQARAGIDVLSLDWSVDLARARADLPDSLALQGNLDPALMETTPEIVRRETTRLLDSMRGKYGHIVNLGHGIRPQAKPECVNEMVQTVTQYQ
jgi:uroporphyrinogen decarboxylase